MTSVKGLLTLLKFLANWGGGSQKSQTIAIVLDYSTDLDDKFLLLKASQTSSIEHGETVLVLTWKHPFYGLAFIVLKFAMHATHGKKKHQSYQL